MALSVTQTTQKHIIYCLRRWNLLDKKHRMPSQLGVQDKYFLKMIDGVNLQRHEIQDITERLITQYHQEGSSEQPFSIPLECPVCPIRGNGLKVRMRNEREVRASFILCFVFINVLFQRSLSTTAQRNTPRLRLPSKAHFNLRRENCIPVYWRKS